MTDAPDEGLRPFATERQWEVLQALATEGGERAAARRLGINFSAVNKAHKAVLNKAAKMGYAPEHDMKRTVPDGFNVRGVSTYYNKEGKPTGQWVKSQVDRERQEELFREAMQAMAETLPRVDPTRGPAAVHSELMACYPVGDQHLGMLAWSQETGADYDLDIGERVLCGAMDHLVAAAPSCDRAAIVVLGDFMHYDSFDSVTPASRHLLDADSRFPKMVRVAIRSIRYMIAAALARHRELLVIIEIGNHDPSSAIFLAECLANIYEGEPRITIDTSPRHFHYFEFGKCLVGVHHGHGVKMADLPLIMATDRPDLWGKTEFRYWWTGHVHHDQVKDYQGCRVESFRILAPADAWAANKGYRSQRDMKAIILHKEHGEVARHIVNPAMLGMAAAA